jgi:hypothetical protein
MTQNELLTLLYLLRLGCAVEITPAFGPGQITPTFLHDYVLADGRPFGHYREEWETLGGRVMSEVERQEGPIAGWLPALFPGVDAL